MFINMDMNFRETRHNVQKFTKSIQKRSISIRDDSGNRGMKRIERTFHTLI